MTPARRPYGSGGLSQRADGLWVGSVELGVVDGVRKRAVVSSMDPKVADRKLKRKRREVARAAAAARRAEKAAGGGSS